MVDLDENTLIICIQSVNAQIKYLKSLFNLPRHYGMTIKLKTLYLVIKSRSRAKA